MVLDLAQLTGRVVGRRGTEPKCHDCSAPPLPGRTRCAIHAEAQRRSNTRYRASNTQQKEVAGICNQCGRRPAHRSAHPLDTGKKCGTCRAKNTARAKEKRLLKGIKPRTPSAFAGLSGYEYLKLVKFDQRAKGLCESGRCQQPPDPGHFQCRPHLDAMNRGNKAREKKRAAAGLCRQCGEPWTDTRVCPTCRPRTRINADARRAREAREATEQTNRDEQARRELAFIERHLHMLKNDRVRDIVRLRYGPNAQTLEEVGKAFNVTRERIRQIEKKAVETIIMLTIENDIPIPQGTHYTGLRLEILETLKAMEPGQSFVIEHAPGNMRAISTMAKDNDFLIVTRRLDANGRVRVWLTAKTTKPAADEKVL